MPRRKDAIERLLAGDAVTSSDALRQLAQQHRAQNRPHEAVEAAWAAFDLAPAERATKTLLVKLLRDHRDALAAERRNDYLTLLTARDVEPEAIAAAGWALWLRLTPPADVNNAALAVTLENDALALTLLRQAPVFSIEVERVMTRLRRFLLLSEQWKTYPALAAALAEQARLNGGAWPFEVDERMRLEADCHDMQAVYLPPRPLAPAPVLKSPDPVGRAVQAQYEEWPYPPWTRIGAVTPKRLSDVIADFDPLAAQELPADADVLIAGCGSGREVVLHATRFPDAKFTAIDVSAASLAYALQRCEALGIANVSFRQFDLHDVADLDRSFHAIFCHGVLHHLSDPERGLKQLAAALRPRGVMRIMVYSRVMRLRVAAARLLIQDLLQEPVSDDLLRRVRKRLLQLSEHPVVQQILRWRDFATLAGTHDLLLHPHEDPFDLRRLQRALVAAELNPLTFDLPAPVRARYVAMFPGDTQCRDLETLERFEKHENGGFIGNYQFWCQRAAVA